MDSYAADDVVDDSGSIGLGCALETFKEQEEVERLIQKLCEIYKDQNQSETSYQRFLYILNQYQEQPHLLDPHLDLLLEKLLSIARFSENEDSLQHAAFKYLYVVTKVRGYKIVLRHLPHEVRDVEQVLALINKQNPQDCETWETRYMLLLWMSIVVIIPFHMSRLDNTTEDTKPIMKRILDMIQLYLSVSDKARDAAAFLASRFITRPEVKSLYLAEYLDWSLKMLADTDTTTMSGLSLQAGVLSSLAQLFKHGKREDVKEHGVSILKKILECGFKDSNCTTVRKMALKLLQRIGLSFLKVKVAKWRYSRGTRSLADNLAGSEIGFCRTTARTNSYTDDDEMNEEDDDYDIPEETEDVIEQLLVGLRDKDTVLRWSAAKGIGRITSRLPKDLADDVVTSVLELFSLRESDSAWHGGCLALAELGRRGLILPQHLSKVVSVVLKALVYDELRGNFSVGANIRDAACYVCWSFARAYDPTVLQPYVNSIAGALLVTAVFDREVNCRRAASAAFQENVGRQGTFPHGIEILTVADYYAVGLRQNAYLNISTYIGNFTEYSLTLINHLLEFKVNHWDASIRELTAKTLNNLTSENHLFMVYNALPKLLTQVDVIDLNTRHGALLAVAEIIHALYEVANKNEKNLPDMLGNSILETIRNIVFSLNERKFFRGLGGIITRTAVCSLIKNVSRVKLPFHQDETLLALWQEILDSSIQHNDASVRTAAVSALPHFCTCYYSNNPNQLSKLVGEYVSKLKSSSVETRCGCALALGSLPKFVLIPHVSEVLEALCQCASLEEQYGSAVESRRDAVKAISQIALTAEVYFDNVETNPNISTVELVYACLLAAMEDYTVDSRGEVGTLVREAAMNAIQEVTLTIAQHEPKLLNEQVVLSIFSSLLQQCVEKIDRTRSVAGSVFKSLLHSEPRIPNIPYLDSILEVFSLDVCNETNWASQADTFHQFVKLLPLEKLTYNLLLGFVVSVGGLTESLVKYSRSALVRYLDQVDEKLLIHVSETLLMILKDNLRNDRVLVPFFKMMDHLLVSGIQFQIADLTVPFNEQLLDLVWQSSYKSGDPQKLFAAIDLFCDLLQCDAAYTKRSLSRLAIFLCHRFPRVRVVTANKMYEAFISYDFLEAEAQEDVLNVLSETEWDAPIEKLRPIRNELCEKLGVPPPSLKRK